MPNMKSLSLTVQKLQRRLKLTTDRQTDKQTNRQTDRRTGQKQYAPDHSIRGHKKVELSYCTCLFHDTRLFMWSHNLNIVTFTLKFDPLLKSLNLGHNF